MSNWNEALHPRVPAGSPEGGEFTRGPRYDYTGGRFADIKAEIERQLNEHKVQKAPVSFYVDEAPSGKDNIAGAFTAGVSRSQSSFFFNVNRIPFRNVSTVVAHEISHAKFNMARRRNAGALKRVIEENAVGISREAPFISSYANSFWTTKASRTAAGRRRAVNETLAESAAFGRVFNSIDRVRAVVDKYWDPSKTF